MRRVLMIASLVAVVVVLHSAEARAGASAGQLVGSFSGPAFLASAIVNVDAAHPDNNCVTDDINEPCKGQVTMSIRQGSTTATETFRSGYVRGFAFGCDGVNGADDDPTTNPSPPLTSQNPAKELAQRRFEGVDWLPTAAASALLAPFGITYAPPPFFTFSHITRAECTLNEEGFWVLLLQGIMQFGDPL